MKQILLSIFLNLCCFSFASRLLVSVLTKKSPFCVTAHYTAKKNVVSGAFWDDACGLRFFFNTFTCCAFRLLLGTCLYGL